MIERGRGYDAKNKTKMVKVRVFKKNTIYLQ